MPIEFTIDVRDSTGGFWSEKFALAVHAPAIELYVNSLSDTLPYGNNNGVIEEGENFLLKIALKNFGSGVAQASPERSAPSTATSSSSTAPRRYADIALLGVANGEGFVLSETEPRPDQLFTFEAVDRFGRSSPSGWSFANPARPRPSFSIRRYGPNEIHATWRRPDSLEAYRYQVYHSQTHGRAVHARE